MKKILFISAVFYVTSLFSQDPNVLLGLESPAYGVKVKINYPERNSGWSRAFQIVNEDDTKKFISFGGYGSIADGVAHLNYGWIGESYNKAFMIFKPNGNVGIGTSTPSEKLEIKDGNIRIQGLNTSRYIRFGEDELLGAFINYDGRTNVLNIGVNNINTADISNDYNAISIVRSSGNVGIGTTSTGSHKLAVEGSIGAREIKVEGSGWSDFVFENSYKLPSLENVEQHIKEKGHLKDIPSAKEVEKNGFFLGEMDAKLLQKIEELTLYTIQQEKEIKELKKQNSKINKQQKELEELKTLVKNLLKTKELN